MSPKKAAVEIPDRSRPETTGRELSLDEKKEDVVRLRKVAQALLRERDHLGGLRDPEMRASLQKDLTFYAEMVEASVNRRVNEIRAAIFAVTGDRDDVRKKDGYTYQKRFR